MIDDMVDVDHDSIASEIKDLDANEFY